MRKVCSLCDYEPEVDVEVKPDDQPEDCPKCGGHQTVKPVEETEDDEE